jgi:membrane protein DedA with SNARE-associated domain
MRYSRRGDSVKNNLLGFIIFLGFVVWSGFVGYGGYFSGKNIGYLNAQKDAIKAEVAYYDPHTGVIIWGLLETQQTIKALEKIPSDLMSKGNKK